MDWWSLDKTSGTGDDSVTVSVTENAGASPRGVRITLACGGETATVTVNQEGAGRTPLFRLPVDNEWSYFNADSLQVNSVGSYYGGDSAFIDPMPIDISASTSTPVNWTMAKLKLKLNVPTAEIVPDLILMALPITPNMNNETNYLVIKTAVEGIGVCAVIDGVWGSLMDSFPVDEGYNDIIVTIENGTLSVYCSNYDYTFTTSGMPSFNLITANAHVILGQLTLGSTDYPTSGDAEIGLFELYV